MFKLQLSDSVSEMRQVPNFLYLIDIAALEKTC